MGKFAKLFDVDEEQVLVQTETDEIGNPTIRVVTEVEGVEAAIRITFEQKDSNKPYSLDKAWDACDKAFNAITEKDAVGLREKLVSGFMGR